MPSPKEHVEEAIPETLEFDLKVKVSASRQNPPVFQIGKNDEDEEVFRITLTSNGSYAASWFSTASAFALYREEHAHLLG